jgi:hypothetical protein
METGEETERDRDIEIERETDSEQERKRQKVSVSDPSLSPSLSLPLSATDSLSVPVAVPVSASASLSAVSSVLIRNFPFSATLRQIKAFLYTLTVSHPPPSSHVTSNHQESRFFPSVILLESKSGKSRGIVIVEIEREEEWKARWLLETLSLSLPVAGERERQTERETERETGVPLFEGRKLQAMPFQNSPEYFEIVKREEREKKEREKSERGKEREKVVVGEGEIKEKEANVGERENKYLSHMKREKDSGKEREREGEVNGYKTTVFVNNLSLDVTDRDLFEHVLLSLSSSSSSNNNHLNEEERGKEKEQMRQKILAARVAIDKKTFASKVSVCLFWLKIGE